MQFILNIEIGNMTLGAAACCQTKDALDGTQYGQVNSYVTKIKWVNPTGGLEEASEEESPELLARLCCALLVVGAILLILPVGKVFAQESREPGQPPEVQIVRTREVTVITLAGVGPRDKDGKLVAPGDFAAQFKQTWENLRRLVLSAGSPLRSIVSITVYTPDAKWQDAFKELQQESFSDWNPPTSFAVTQQLRTPGALLEIHAVAVIENRKPIRR